MNFTANSHSSTIILLKNCSDTVFEGLLQLVETSDGVIDDLLSPDINFFFIVSNCHSTWLILEAVDLSNRLFMNNKSYHICLDHLFFLQSEMDIIIMYGLHHQ